jgi:hypothetical protein
VTTPESNDQIEPDNALKDSKDYLGVADLLSARASHFRQRHFTRPRTLFRSKEGEEFHASADQVDISVEDAANVKVWLRTHDKEIVMTIGGILLAAGAIKIQKNRSQRKKMSSRTSSSRRQPRKG